MTPRRFVPTLGLLLILALALRAFPNNSGASDMVHPRHDEVYYVNHVSRFLQGDWRVDYFINPSLYMVVLWGATVTGGAALVGLGEFVSFEEFLTQASTNAYWIAITGRVLSMVFGLAAVVLLWAIGRRLFSTRVGLLAAAALAIDRTHVDRSVLAGNEAFLVCLVLAGFLCVLRYLESPTARRHALAGALLGLAASAKYNGGLLLFPLIGASLLAWRAEVRAGGARRPAPRHWVGFAVAPLAFLAGSPWVALNWTRFLEDFRTQSGYLSEGWVEREVELAESGWRYYVEAFPLENAGLPLAILCGAGVLGALWQVVVRRDARLLPLLLAALPAYLLLGSGVFHRMRFLLPAIPFLLLLGAWALDRLLAALISGGGEPTESVRGDRIGAGLLITGSLLLAGPALANYRYIRGAAGVLDTRTELVEWIATHCDPEELMLELNPLGSPLLAPPRRPTPVAFFSGAQDLPRAIQLPDLLLDCPTFEDFRAAVAEGGYRHLLVELKAQHYTELLRLPELVHHEGLVSCAWWEELVRYLVRRPRSEELITSDGEYLMTRIELGDA